MSLRLWRERRYAESGTYEFELIEKLCKIGFLGYSVEVIGGIGYGERNNGNCNFSC